MNWYIQVLQKYVVFGGRARRKEYWMFFLFNVLISIGLGIVDAFAGLTFAEGTVGILGTVYALGVLLPSLAVSIRRLHDTDRSGWWCLIAFVPIIGVIVLLIFFVLDGTPGDNRFGPSPKAA